MWIWTHREKANVLLSKHPQDRYVISSSVIHSLVQTQSVLRTFGPEVSVEVEFSFS